VQQQALKKEVNRQKSLVKNKFYPYLLANTTSVEDAKNLLQMSSGIIEQVFQKKVSDYQTELSGKKLSTLDVISVLKTNKETERERFIIDMFKDETIATADALLTGMKREIEGRILEEGTKRKLDTVASAFTDNNQPEHE
jgi:hypothetical protein